MRSSSIFRPYQLECLIALVARHWKKRWPIDFSSWPHSTQERSSILIQWSKVSLVGKALEPILQISILILLGILSFLSFFQLTSNYVGGKEDWVARCYADLTLKFPLFCNHMSLSDLGVGGRCMERMAFAKAESNKSLTKLVFHAKDSWSMSWDTMSGFGLTVLDFGIGLNPLIQGTYGSHHMFIEAPFPIRW